MLTDRNLFYSKLKCIFYQQAKQCIYSAQNEVHYSTQDKHRSATGEGQKMGKEKGKGEKTPFSCLDHIQSTKLTKTLMPHLNPLQQITHKNGSQHLI